MATADGGWRFAGREDTLLKIKGRWVNLNDLEERLGASTPGLVEGAAVRVADADGLDARRTSTWRAKGRSAVEALLRQRSETLPHHQRPAMQPVDGIPRTATGKLFATQAGRIDGARRMTAAPDIPGNAPQRLRTQRLGSRLVVTLDRPPVSAIDDELLLQLDAAIDQAEADDGISVLHLRECPQGVLRRCRPGDPVQHRHAAGRNRMVAVVLDMQRVFLRLENAPCVTIAELGGAAVGGGLRTGPGL